MAFTKETARAAGNKGRAHRTANRAATAATAVAEPPTSVGPEQPGEVLPAQSDILAGLMALASGLEDKKKQETAVDQLDALLNKIDFRAYPDLAKSDAIQKLVERVQDARPNPADLMPGDVIGENMNQRQIEWTWRHVMENKRQDPSLEYVEWEPRFTDVIIWNGLRIRVEDGVMVRTPRVFKDIHDEARRAQQAAKEHAEWLMRKRNHLTDPTLLGKMDQLQGVTARGFIQQGVFEPGGGLNMLPPDQQTFEMSARLSGEEVDGGAGEGEGSEAGAAA